MLPSIRTVPVSGHLKQKLSFWGALFSYIVSANEVFRMKAEHFSFKMKVLASWKLAKQSQKTPFCSSLSIKAFLRVRGEEILDGSLFRFHLSPFPLETPDTQARICIYLWQISSSAIFVTIWLFLHSIYTLSEGDVRVCDVAFLHNFWCGFAVIFILSCSIAVLQNRAVCGI